jgi:hypothetical protein
MEVTGEEPGVRRGLCAGRSDHSTIL